MIYFISRQRVSIKTGQIIKSARRRLIKSIDSDNEQNAREIFELEYSNTLDKTHRYELTDGQWRHICYMQEGIVT